jgi:hypothetical protein
MTTDPRSPLRQSEAPTSPTKTRDSDQPPMHLTVLEDGLFARLSPAADTVIAWTLDA